jgi:HD-like signal output (HDOD) protein
MEARKLTQESIVSRLDELPTLPTIVYELSQVINVPMSSTTDVEKIMSQDVSMTTKVLRLVNSAYYAIPGGVSSLGRAIGYIGFETVNQLVLAVSILKALEVKGPQKFNMNEFWKHCLGVGFAAETIGKYVNSPQSSDLFTCGLLHDMGKVALYSLAQDSMMSVVTKAEQSGLSYSEAEVELDLPRHTLIGQALAQKWQLPSMIQNCIKYHHAKDHQMRGTLTSDHNRSVDAIFMANLLVHALKFGHSGHTRILSAPRETMERLGMSPDKDLKPLLQQIKTSLDHAADFLRVLEGK